MFCGFWRTPPRRPALSGRLAVLLCLLVCFFVGSAGPAQAYVCAPGSSHAPRVAGQKNCERPRPQRAWRKEGDADAMSFVFFLGAVVTVLLIPVAFGRRDEVPPE
jgi:hypothetical protein